MLIINNVTKTIINLENVSVLDIQYKCIKVDEQQEEYFELVVQTSEKTFIFARFKSRTEVENALITIYKYY